MIKNFKHKGLKHLFQNDDARKLPADMADRLRGLLAALDEAELLEDLVRPSFRFHSLKGDLKGFYSITVRANWRITFRYEDGHVFDVDFLDYH